MLRPKQLLLCYVIILTITTIIFVTNNTPSPMKTREFVKNLHLKAEHQNNSSAMKTNEKSKLFPQKRPGGKVETLHSEETQPKASMNVHSNKVDEYEVVGWEKHVDRNPLKYIEPSKDTAVNLGQSKPLCKTKSSIVVIVTTKPESVNNRMVIRNTWASQKIRDVEVGFIVGKSKDVKVSVALNRESVKYQDIIHETFTDSYFNVTLKSILLLKWFLHNCPTSEFLVKVDDDTFVDVKDLAEDLSKLPRSGILRGFPPIERVVNRDSKNPRYVPRYMYPNDTYPEFLSGAGYFMSRDVVTQLYGASLITPIVHLDDVYITGLCATKAGLKPEVYEGTKHVKRIMAIRGCIAAYTMCHGLNLNQIKLSWAKRKYYENHRLWAW